MMRDVALLFMLLAMLVGTVFLIRATLYGLFGLYDGMWHWYCRMGLAFGIAVAAGAAITLGWI